MREFISKRSRWSFLTWFLWMAVCGSISSQSFLKVQEKQYDNIALGDSLLKGFTADDGSFVVAGVKPGSGSGTTVLLAKFSQAGELTWEKSVGGGSGRYQVISVCKSNAEGFYVLGVRRDSPVKKYLWLGKFDSNGTILWENLTDIGENETLSDLCESSDFGVFVCGAKEIKGDHDTDAWLIKFNKKGSLESQALFGSRYINDAFCSITRNNQGGHILSGYTSEKLGNARIPYFVSVDKRGSRVWEKNLPAMTGVVPVSTWGNLSKGKVITLAKDTQGRTVKIIQSESGETEKVLKLDNQLKLTKGSYILFGNDDLLCLSAPGKSPLGIPYLIRVNDSMTPLWIQKTPDVNCLMAVDGTRFFSAGISSAGEKLILKTSLFQDQSETMIAQFIEQNIQTAGRKPGESNDDFRKRIGDKEYTSSVTKLRNDAVNALLLLPDLYTRDAGSPSDQRPSIISSYKKDGSPENAVAIKGNYYALLIAINEYKDANINSLDKPISDAEKLFEVLLNEYLFEKNKITFLKNPTREQIISSLDRLEKEITKNDNLLIFYAGHGYWNDVTQKGYWLASDAAKENTANWIANSSISDYIRSIPAKHTLLIADACFSGSIFKTRAAFGGLDKPAQRLYELTSRKAMTSGTLTEVPDKSVFIEYLIKRLRDNPEPYISSEQLFFSFKPAVLNNTENIPQFGVVGNAGDEGGDFIFIKRK